MLAFVCSALICSGGWSVLCDLPGIGYPTGVHRDSIGNHVVRMFSDSLIQELCFSPEGNIISEKGSVPMISAEFDYSVVSVSGGYETESVPGIACVASGDTLWITELGYSIHDEEFPGMILPAREGCYALISPAVHQGRWSLSRIDSSGRTVFRSDFSLRGGPVISVNDMAELPGGGIIATGVTDDLGTNLFMFLRGFGSGGEELFSIRDSLRFHASGEIVLPDSGGNVYVCGNTGSERDDGYFMPPADTDVFLICYDLSGSELWRSMFPLPLENTPVVMCHDARDGTFSVAISSFPEDLSEYPVYSLAVFKPD